ncbi:MAG: hydrogenase maturation nickel metallochaperone HypA [Acidobacteria bacterium]|nr:hydrogenase maturation nickel metallochaperone HypA [Acidobacteriota bacterium]
MHEMGIASSVIEAVKTELARYPGARATKVGLRLGEFAGVDQASLSFCFEALVRDTGLEPLALEFEFCPRGRELDLIFLEIDET